MKPNPIIPKEFLQQPTSGGVNIQNTFLGGSTPQTTGSVVTTILNTALAVSAVIILFMFVYAGIQMIAGAGSGKSENSEKAKQAATYAAIGFVIIFVAYWLIKLIELLTGQNFITNPTL